MENVFLCDLGARCIYSYSEEGALCPSRLRKSPGNLQFNETDTLPEFEVEGTGLFQIGALAHG